MEDEQVSKADMLVAIRALRSLGSECLEVPDAHELHLYGAKMFIELYGKAHFLAHYLTALSIWDSPKTAVLEALHVTKNLPVGEIDGYFERAAARVKESKLASSARDFDEALVPMESADDDWQLRSGFRWTPVGANPTSESIKFHALATAAGMTPGQEWRARKYASEGMQCGGIDREREVEFYKRFLAGDEFAIRPLTDDEERQFKELQRAYERRLNEL